MNNTENLIIAGEIYKLGRGGVLIPISELNENIGNNEAFIERHPYI